MPAVKPDRAFWALWLILLLAKGLIAIRLPLFGDEAWYWLEGQHPAWAYSDLPALTAWLIRLGVEAAGNSYFGVRWPFIALSMATPLLLRASAARWFGRDAGDWAGILALLLPLLGILGFLALPDVPLTFAAALCLHAALRLAVGPDTRAAFWLGLGLVIGGLSHYRFAPLIAAGFVGLLLDAGGRRALRDLRVWLALLVGAAAWVPLLIWNLAHDEAGLDFQLAQRHPWSLHSEGIWLPLSQLLAVTPLLLFLLLATLHEGWRKWRAGAPGPWGLIVGTAAVPLLLYLPLAFFADRERVSFHWLQQAWLPLLVVAPIVFERWRTWAQATTVGLAMLALIGALVLARIAWTPALRAELADSRWYPDNFAGWVEISDVVRPFAAQGLEPVADNFMLGAQLAFALQRPDLEVLDHPLNHKHGRAVQLRAWKMETAIVESDSQRRMLVLEDTAMPLRRRLDHYRGLCGAGVVPGRTHVVSLDHGRKRFLRFLPEHAAGCVLPALAWIDVPVPRATLGMQFDVAGWAFKDGAGIARVEITLDEEVVADADYGLPRPHVAQFWQTSADTTHPNVGFQARVDASDFTPGDHWLGLVLHGRDGSIEHWPEQRIHLDPRVR